MKTRFALASFIAVAGLACAASGSVITSVNNVKVIPYLFGDRPDSELTITNNYPASVTILETGFGAGGFANRHEAYFSTDNGATAADFNYGDEWDVSVTITHVASDNVVVEAGIHSDLFGLGFFGQLPNGEVVSFGSVLPFYSFGTLPFSNQISLRIVHTPGTGDGVNPLPMGGTPSTIEYLYDLGSGWVSSGPILWTTGEGGLPSNFTFNMGFGAQHNQAAETGARAETIFSNITTRVPAPGAVALFGLVGIAGLRRRSR
jgi:MYXO-CTERM domain-containing protein